MAPRQTRTFTTHDPDVLSVSATGLVTPLEPIHLELTPGLGGILRRSWLALLLLGCGGSEAVQPVPEGPGLSGRWQVSLGPAFGGTGPCTLTGLSLELLEKHNETQPVDSLLGSYSGGQGSCPFDPGTGEENFDVGFPLDSVLYGLVDRRGVDTLVHIRFGEPGSGTFEGVVGSPDSIRGSAFVFVQDPAGHVVRADFIARRE
jgi:hypothetical protein